jgi:hypothetical protein
MQLVAIIIVALSLYLYFYADKMFSKKVISRANTGVYLIRYRLIPNNKYMNIYLHKFMDSDLDEALHDHPWKSVGILLNGCYLEHIPKDYNKWIKENDRETKVIKRYPFIPIYRSAETIHRIELIDKKPIWTIFVTWKFERTWMFWCRDGPIPNEKFLAEDKNSVGKGCNQD